MIRQRNPANDTVSLFRLILISSFSLQISLVSGQITYTVSVVIDHSPMENFDQLCSEVGYERFISCFAENSKNR